LIVFAGVVARSAQVEIATEGAAPPDTGDALHLTRVTDNIRVTHACKQRRATISEQPEVRSETETGN